MIFYEIPETITAEHNQFKLDINDYISGAINPIKFKAIRVAHGVYEQRQEHTYMIRIRCAAGGITPAQLRGVAEVGQKYGNGEVHFTTRQEVQVHNVLIQDVMDVIRDLLKVGLSTRGGGGNTVRNILTSPDSGVSKEDVFDVDPYAIALTSRMIQEPDSWNLPRKFKIAFSNNAEDTGITQATCLGFVAKVKDGQKGFEVYCAGGMGARPMVGNQLFDFVPDNHVYHITRSLKIMFDKHGNRRSKHTSRLKFLWKKLQRESFIELFEEEYNQIKDDRSLDLKLQSIDNSGSAEGITPIEVNDPDFDVWKTRYVRDQKQAGLKSIKIPLQLGDLLYEDAVKLTEFLKPIGPNTIRCDRAQNMRLRNIPEALLGNAFQVINSLKKSLVGHAAFIGNMINCTGAQTCKLGICLPRGLSDKIRERLVQSNLDLDQLDNFNLNMSGCPNTCGMHHIADLGFFGKIGRSKARDMYPAYYVLAGAKRGAGKTQYAEKKGEISVHHIPEFVHDFLAAYLVNKDEFPDYNDYLEAEGNTVIATLLDKFKHVPELEEDPSYYTDFGAKRRLSLDEMGTAECSAGMFDMIDVDKKNMKIHQKALDSATSDEKQVHLQAILFATSRMLLVTRGLDAKESDQIFDLFAKHFVETELVSTRYKNIVLMGKSDNKDQLEPHQKDIITLANEVLELYKGMDDSLRFKAKPKPSTAIEHGSAIKKDFRGVACPMNFVKTKLVLQTMKTGEQLEILLDDGEPIENVPNSVKLEGHQILKQEQIESYWRVLIQKA